MWHFLPRQPHRIAGLVAVIAVSVPPGLLAQEQALADQENWSATQQEVWEQEQAYWRFLSAGDHSNYMTLWDEQFVGWSGGKDHPIGRSEVGGPVEENRSGSNLLYDLQPLAVSVHGNVGITYYRGILQNEKGEPTEAARFTHTWRKQDGEWTLISGMSAPATAQAENQLTGAWIYERVNDQGEEPIESPQPGMLLLTDTHYSLMAVSADESRDDLSELDEEASPTQKLKAYKEAYGRFYAHSGRYEVQGDTITFRPWVAKSPDYMHASPDNAFTAVYRVEGDTLTLDIDAFETVLTLRQVDDEPMSY